MEKAALKEQPPSHAFRQRLVGNGENHSPPLYKKTAPVSKLRSLQNDALIARFAVKNSGFVVTMDVEDFETIKREMPKFEVVSADYFFS